MAASRNLGMETVFLGTVSGSPQFKKSSLTTVNMPPIAQGKHFRELQLQGIGRA